MTFYIEFDEGITNDFSFDVEEVVQRVAEGVLDLEECPYEVCVNVLVTDNEGFREFNRQYRNIDIGTDIDLKIFYYILCTKKLS